MVTDLSEKRARKILAELETRSAVIGQAVFQTDAYPPSRSLAVVYTRLSEYKKLRPEASGHVARTLDGEGNPMLTLVVGGSPDRYVIELWQQQLANAYLQSALGEMPGWLLEGMAQYYSTAHIHDDQIRLGYSLAALGFHMDASWVYNDDPAEIRHRAPSSQAIVPSQLVQSTLTDFLRDSKAANDQKTRLAEFRTRALYQLSAWTLVHMMMSGVEPAASALYDALETAANGGAIGPVLESRLGEIGWSVIDEAFYTHMARRETNLWLRDFVAPSRDDVSARAIPESEISAIQRQI